MSGATGDHGARAIKHVEVASSAKLGVEMTHVKGCQVQSMKGSAILKSAQVRF